MKKIIIIGAGGLGREVAWIIERINKIEKTWNLLGFLDDTEEKQDKIINGVKVLGKINDYKKYDDSYFIIAIGSSKSKKEIVNRLIGVKYAIIIDPTAIVSEFVSIGNGTIICANSIVTVNIEIGEHVLINKGCTIGHDVVVESFVCICPSVNLCGYVKICKETELGVGSKVIPQKTVGSNSIIGAGAVVTKDIPDKCTAVGIPAKPIKYHE